ncbi:MAG: cell surface protein SprA, partial [Candidatus Glassbacteria bacterium RBG_16_58_8]
NLDLEPEVMTDLADAIPLVETDVASRLAFTGEVAINLPNPNTRGEVYLDDFEGSSLIDSYGMSRRSWKLSSPPAGLDLDTAEGGGLIWYNLEILDSYLNPNIPSEQDRNRTILALEFAPSDDLPFPNDSWRSLVQPISSSGLDFSEKKFINIWLKGTGGEVWLDLGTVSEDALRFDVSREVMSPNDLLDTEDLNRDGNRDFNEDVGLDGVAGADGTGAPGDDGNDDFVFTEAERQSGDYSKVNGTENNTFLDTEDLNGNNTLETDEKVYRYLIDLDNPDTTRVKVISENPDPNNNWRLFQVQIASPDTSYGNPDLRRIKHLRVLLTDFDAPTSVQFGSIEIEGNSWFDRGVRNEGGDPVQDDEVFDVSVKNTADNDDYFSPPGVAAEQVSSVPTQLQDIKEQSINLIYRDLGSSHLGHAVQPLLTPQNYIDYRSFSVWVRKNGDQGGETDFFFQAGTDSLNFYEYAFTPTSTWQEVVIPFERLTDVKKEALDALPAGGNAPDIDFISGNIRVRGLPSLTNVRRLALGVKNRGDTPVTGEVWVDELRLTGVIRDRGLAQRVAVDADFADVGKVKVEYIGQGDQFRQLNQVRRNLTSRDINFSTSMKLDKFAPAPLGLEIPISYSRSQGKGLPLYRTGSDIVFDEGPEQEEERTQDLSETINISFAKKKASSSPFVRATADKLTSSFTTTSRWSRSPIQQNTSNNENFQVRYNTPFERDYDFPLFPVSLFGFFRHVPLPSLVKGSALAKGLGSSRFRYMPATLGLTGKIERLNTLRINSTSGLRTPYRNLYSTAEVSLTHRPLRSLSGNYQLNVVRDLDQRRISGLLGLFAVNVGTEIRRQQLFQYTYAPEILTWLSPSYSFNTRYAEDHSPQVSRSRGDSLDVRNFSNTTSRDLTLTVGLPKLLSAMAGGGTADRVGADAGKANAGERVGAQEEAVEEKEGGWKRGMLRASRMVKNATIRFGRERLTDYDYVEISPPILYQLGFQDLDLEPRQRNRSRDFSADGGMTFPANVSLTTGYSERNAKNDFRGSSRSTSNVTWPKVGTEISSLKLPLQMRDFLTAVSLSSHYSKNREDSGTESNGLESRRRGVVWSPFFSVSTQLKSGLSASYSLDKSETTTRSYIGSRNTNFKDNSNHQVNLGYSLRSQR